MSNLGERIRQIRKWRGLSQSELEHRSGIKREYLSKLETNDLKNPTYSTLLKLSDALGISLTSLIEAVDTPLPHSSPVIKVVSAQKQLKELKKGMGSSYLAVPIISEEVAAADPLFVAERDIEDYALVPYGWLEGNGDLNRYRCLRLGEDNWAMNPLLCPGSIVCFDTKSRNPQELQQQVVVLRHKRAGIMIRHLKLGDGYIIAVPENLREYGLNIFSLGKENPVIGKVLWCLKQVVACSQ